MKLHDIYYEEDLDSKIVSVLRVHNGWIYRLESDYTDLNGDITSCSENYVFVPET
jgi:hypothetical protein